MKPTDPPALATALLELLISPRTSAGLIGDLIEVYRIGRSRTWYSQQTIVALMMAACREVLEQKFQAIRAIILGYLCGASLCYFITSAAGKFFGPNTVVSAYLLFFWTLGSFGDFGNWELGVYWALGVGSWELTYCHHFRSVATTPRSAVVAFAAGWSVTVRPARRA